MTEEEKIEEFEDDIWELIENYDYAPPGADKQEIFMVAGCLLSSALGLYVMTLGEDSTINLLMEAIERVAGGEDEDYKKKLH